MAGPIKQAINTGEIMAKKGGASTMACHFYGANVESVTHLFLKCSFAKSLLFVVKTLLNVTGRPKDLIHFWSTWRRKKIERGLRKGWDQLVMAITWQIWLMRNRGIFLHEASSINGVGLLETPLHRQWKR